MTHQFCSNVLGLATTILKKDISGNITTDINTAVVTPRAPAAGYIAPEIQSFEGTGPGTGQISISILNPDSIRNNNTYRLEFYDDTPFHNSAHPKYSILNVINGDTLLNQKTWVRIFILMAQLW